MAPDEWGPLVSRSVTRFLTDDFAGANADLDLALTLGPPPEGVRLIEEARTVITIQP
jgi:hypothetical protein